MSNLVQPTCPECKSEFLRHHLVRLIETDDGLVTHPDDIDYTCGDCGCRFRLEVEAKKIEGTETS